MSTKELWKVEGQELVGTNNDRYQLLPNEFWYVVPNRLTYSSEEGKRVRPLEFAIVLHNAFLGSGLLVSPTVLGHGTEPKTLKRGVAEEAENLLEQIRLSDFSGKPSRLLCYFLNIDRSTANHRMRDILRGNKKLVRCYIIANGANVHFADSEIYERLEGRPDDKVLARTYWENFTPKNNSENKRMEVLADSALFFPDWQTFQTIPTENLVNWIQDNPSNMENR